MEATDWFDIYKALHECLIDRFDGGHPKEFLKRDGLPPLKFAGLERPQIRFGIPDADRATSHLRTRWVLKRHVNYLANCFDVPSRKLQNRRGKGDGVRIRRQYGTRTGCQKRFIISKTAFGASSRHSRHPGGAIPALAQSGPSAAPGLAKVAQGQSPRSTHNLTVMADASRAKGLICHLVQNDPSDTRRMPRLTDACRTMLVSRPGARNHLALA